MTSRWQTMIRALAKARLELVFPAVANNWLVICMARQIETADGANPVLLKMSLPLLLTLGAVIALGLAVYSLALNDVMDVRHDRAFSPERVLPAGGVGVPVAMAAAVIGLLAAIGASVFLGGDSVLLCVAAALAALVYNTFAKFVPAVAATNLGLIWALGMVILNPRIGFAWPVWLTLTHVMGCTLALHVIEGKRPRLRAPDWLSVAGSWVFCTLVLELWMSVRNTDLPEMVEPQPGLWIGPLVALAVFLVAAGMTLQGHMNSLRARREAAGTFRSLAMLWLIAYGAGWLLSADAYWPGMLMLALFFFAYGVMRLGAIIVRLTGPEPTYRVRAQAE